MDSKGFYNSIHINIFLTCSICLSIELHSGARSKLWVHARLCAGIHYLYPVCWTPNEQDLHIEQLYNAKGNILKLNKSTLSFSVFIAKSLFYVSSVQYNWTCYEQPLLWAANLLWEATWPFPKMSFRPVPSMLIGEVRFSILWTLITLAWPPNSAVFFRVAGGMPLPLRKILKNTPWITHSGDIYLHKIKE